MLLLVLLLVLLLLVLLLVLLVLPSFVSNDVEAGGIAVASAVVAVTVVVLLLDAAVVVVVVVVVVVSVSGTMGMVSVTSYRYPGLRGLASTIGVTSCITIAGTEKKCVLMIDQYDQGAFNTYIKRQCCICVYTARGGDIAPSSSECRCR